MVTIEVSTILQNSVLKHSTWLIIVFVPTCPLDLSKYYQSRLAYVSAKYDGGLSSFSLQILNRELDLS